MKKVETTYESMWCVTITVNEEYNDLMLVKTNFSIYRTRDEHIKLLKDIIKELESFKS